MNRNMENIDIIKMEDISIETGHEEVITEQLPAPLDLVNKKEIFSSRQIKRELDRVKKRRRRIRRTVCIIVNILVVLILVIIICNLLHPVSHDHGGSILPALIVDNVFLPFRLLGNLFGNLFSDLRKMPWIGIFK